MPNFTGGLGSQLGFATETTYATPVTPAKFLPYNPGETMKLTRAFLESKGLRAGRMVQSASLRVPTTRMGGGGLGFEVLNQGFGPILNQLHGETVTPVKIGATTVYKQVHNIGTTDPFKKSLTVQLGKPTVEGVVEPYTYPGTVTTALGLVQPANGFLTATPTWDSNDELTATALASASYATGLLPTTFVQCAVKVATVAQTLARAIEVNFATARDTARFPLGAEKKLVPLTNAYVDASINLTVDYKDQTLYNFFAKGEQTSLEVTWTFETFEATAVELKLLFEKVGFDGDSPNVANEGELQQVIPLKMLDDGTHSPCVATYVAKDVTL